MPNKYQKYEIAVKLNNERVVQYHNVNTGLFKFHRFIKSKFQTEWRYYTVRRILDKEIIGTFNNSQTIEIKAIRLINLEKQRNERNTGYFVRIPFEREGYIINRNLFFSDKVVLEVSNDFITVGEGVYRKAIKNALNELTAYYKGKGHLIADNEITLADFRFKFGTYKKEVAGIEPEQDYP